MSGFAAIFRFDGAPADREALARMTGAISYRGPDGIAQWSEGGAAMAHLMLHTTAESLEENQPLANDDASLILVMDGWLANYDELRADLLARGCRLRSRADAELVLRAFETWGEECPKHIDGEYAFVVWDVRGREAFCFRDHAGLRPLHYHWDGSRLLVASDLAGILAAGDFDLRPNRGMIAEHLAARWPTPDETLWQGVNRLLPAHSMRVGRTGPRSQPYWLPPLEVSIRYPRDEDYQAHYRDLLIDCVRRASRCHTPLACEVSGGLDSSAVFAAAHLLLGEGRLAAPAVKGFTFLFDPADPADEIAFARAVGDHVGGEISEIPPFTPDLAWFAERGRADRDLPLYPNSAYSETIGKALVADGCRVALNGLGGDEFTAGSPLYLAEQIVERDWTRLAASLRMERAAFGGWEMLRRLCRNGIGPAMPLGVRRLRRRLARYARESKDADPLWLNGELRQILRERRRSSLPAAGLEILSPTRRAMYMVITDGQLLYAHDVSARQAARHGFEYRSPMFARTFMEFAFSIPEHLRIEGRAYKRLHARSLAGLLPEAVLHRTTKAYFDSAFDRLIDSIESFMTESRQPDLGIGAVRQEAQQLIDHHRGADPAGYRPIYEIWSLFGCASLFAGDGFEQRR